MSSSHDFGLMKLEQLLDFIGSPAPSSGAGASAAVALALAVACALKAVNVTLKHADDAKLGETAKRLGELRTRALERARVDAEAFERYLEAHESRDVARLVIAGEEFQALSREVAREIANLRGAVRDTVGADVEAAQALHDAAAAIEARILHDDRRLRAHIK